ncbi:unnamed protein product (macronuclear) [Paramecium tetraurelia]|uniref:Trichocyst matrix protein n=1 Tax=Paramecium tetraurelia TaxID=5888 RepID=A0DUG1_PARTE|nr:uncharacterized protein GSPATT00020350001 [Paramecium tetraurelia]CAK86678.1 unnamed protein product [Paramecium tetraurelia]|eukprot:XP_001454075.1 hypothetical protein (macronuclear) [Paramecium tetraurelia strain d4-2]
MKKALLLVLVIVGSLATEFDDQIAELEETQFGQTILQTIQMEMQTDDPVVSNLVDIMQHLEQTLEGEQKRDDERIVRFKQNCDIALSQLTEIINTSTVTSLTLKSDLDSLNPQKVQAVASLERKNLEIADLKAEIDYQTLKRQKESATYQTILDNLEQALFGVNQVKGYFNKYLDVLVKNRNRFQQPQPSFLQEDFSFQYNDEDVEEDIDSKGISSFAQVAQKVNKLKHHVHLEGYKSMIEILSQLASKAQTSADEPSQCEVLTRKVLSILKQIENYIQSERIREDQAENLRQSSYEDLRTLLSDQLVKANQDKTYMEGLIDSLSNRIQQAKNEKFEVDQKITTKSKEKENRENDCRLKRQEYETDTASRIKQKRSVAVAVDLISSKLGQLKRKLISN